MSWASGRRFFIIALVVVVLAAIAGWVGYSVLHKAPSCVDGKQNQAETGVDCGGPCSTVCAENSRAPVVSFVRALRISDSRTDVIAYIENPNASYSAKHAKYHIELYDAARAVVDEEDGTVDLPPGAVTPIYIANAYQGTDPVA